MVRFLFVVFLLVFSALLGQAAQRPNQLIDDNHRAQFLIDVAKVLETNRENIIPLLNEIGAYPGASYEVDQSIKALRGAVDSELKNFKNIKGLRKLVIYGSSNIPLYTLTLQVIIPSLVFDQVVFKVSSKTKSVYQRLWDLLRKPLAEKYVLGDLMTSNSRSGISDLVMDHIAGKTSDGHPADVVVFTGNPQNGDELIAQAEKAIREEAQIKNHRMLFLKFGAGMNPVVIDSQIGEADLPKAIDASLEHFLVNSGQDCISPNFSLLPIAQRDQAIRLIRNQVARIQYGDLQDRSADYSSLTFGTQNTISSLAVFKEKYKSYLVTSIDAQVDPISKRVDPHVFVMPGRLFKELPLEEFYAPFAVFFTYESQEELNEMIQDSRLAKKAMFASLFGSQQSASFIQTRDALIKTRHLVFENASVFSAEDRNKPFGGFGSDVSTVNYIDKVNGVTSNRQFVRPLLISKEVRKGFGTIINTTQVENKKFLSNANSKVEIASRFSVENLAPTKSIIHLERKAISGFTGLLRFISNYSVLNQLVSEQQKYFASKFKEDFLPGQQMVSTRGGLLSESHFLKASEIEKQIIAGTYSKVLVASESLVQLHVDDIGDVTIVVEGRPEEVILTTKLISQALEEDHSLNRFKAYDSLSGLNSKSIALIIQQFLGSLRDINLSLDSKEINIETIVRYFEHHPNLRSFLYPIQKWSDHPLILQIESEEKRRIAQEAYSKSTLRYLRELHRIAQLNLGEIELRKQIGLWVWGVENKKFSELIGPWNSQLKILKSAQPKVLRCEMLFAL